MADRNEWLALAERCAEATGRDNNLEWDLMEASLPDLIGHVCTVPSYTGSLDAIVSLIERELPGAGMDLSKYWLATPESPVWSATLTFGIHGKGGRSEDRPTPAIALCAAFCLAMSEKETVNV